jgi:hypothetical protein
LLASAHSYVGDGGFHGGGPRLCNTTLQHGDRSIAMLQTTGICGMRKERPAGRRVCRFGSRQPSVAGLCTASPSPLQPQAGSCAGDSVAGLAGTDGERARRGAVIRSKLPDRWRTGIVRCAQERPARLRVGSPGRSGGPPRRRLHGLAQAPLTSEVVRPPARMAAGFFSQARVGAYMDGHLI